MGVRVVIVCYPAHGAVGQFVKLTYGHADNRDIAFVIGVKRCGAVRAHQDLSPDRRVLNSVCNAAFVAENVSCPASQFCGAIAKLSVAHCLDITNIFDNWFKRIGFGLLVLI